MNTEITNKIDALFEELVPISGKAESRAGELIRAICRIGHRFYNDGDMIGIDYGKETCNPAARYLMKYGDDAVEAAFDDLHGWWMNDTAYEAFLDKLAAAVLNQVETHPELRNEPTEDMWELYDPNEDVWEEEDEEEEDDWEEEEEEE